MFRRKGSERVYRLSVSLHKRGARQPYLKSVSKGFEMPQPGVKLDEIVEEAARAIEMKWGNEKEPA